MVGAGPTTSVFVHQGFSIPTGDSRLENPSVSTGKNGTCMVTQEAVGPTCKEVVDQVVPFCCCDTRLGVCGPCREPSRRLPQGYRC